MNEHPTAVEVEHGPAALPLMDGPLPLTVEQVDARWLADALRSAGANDVGVSRLAVKSVLPGTATKILVEATYERSSTPNPPRALCVKGGFNEQLRNFAPGNIYALESVFFARIHPRLRTAAPRCWFAGVDEANSHGVVVLDDVAARGATFGDPLQPMSADDVAAGLSAQAHWHARSFGWTPDDVPELPVGSRVVRDAGQALLSREYWDQHYAQSWAPVLPPSQRDRARTRRAIEALYARNDTGPLCVVHGDAHLGNTYLEPGQKVSFLDWQAVHLGAWAYDVAYFLTGALPVDVRRERERDLLTHYLAELSAHGGPALTFDAAFAEYRLNCLHGFMWTTTPSSMQPVERVRAMSDRHIAAIEDHDSVALALAAT